MIITLQDGNHISSGEFSVHRSPVPFVSVCEDPITFLQVDDEGNVHMLDVQTNHRIVIPKSSWEMDDTPQKKETEIVEPQISKDILELFCDLQSEYVPETHKELISTLTIKQYLYPIIK